MSKYIDAGKLKYEIERRNLSERYITTERYEEELYEIIDSLEEEQEIWKPSEEQMEVLEYVIRDYREDSCNATANYLQEILDHLKNM